MAIRIDPAEAAVNAGNNEASMGSINMRGRTLRAMICEIERSLFHIRYQIGGAERGGEDLPRFWVGTSATDAEHHIRQKALESGFEAVLVGYELVIPSVAFLTAIAPGCCGVPMEKARPRGVAKIGRENRALRGRVSGTSMTHRGELPVARH